MVPRTVLHLLALHLVDDARDPDLRAGGRVGDRRTQEIFLEGGFQNAQRRVADGSGDEHSTHHGIAKLAGQPRENLRGEGRIDFRNDDGDRLWVLVHQFRRERGFGHRGETPPEELIGASQDVGHDVRQLLGRNNPREQLLGLPRAADEIGSIHRQLVDHVVDELLEDGSRDAA